MENCQELNYEDDMYSLRTKIWAKHGTREIFCRRSTGNYFLYEWDINSKMNDNDTRGIGAWKLIGKIKINKNTETSAFHCIDPSAATQDGTRPGRMPYSTSSSGCSVPSADLVLVAAKAAKASLLAKIEGQGDGLGLKEEAAVTTSDKEGNMSSVKVFISNEKNSAENNPPGFSVWVGGKSRGDIHNGAVKLTKGESDKILEVNNNSLSDEGNLLTWYFNYEWYSGASLKGPFKEGQKISLPKVTESEKYLNHLKSNGCFEETLYKVMVPVWSKEGKTFNHLFGRYSLKIRHPYGVKAGSYINVLGPKYEEPVKAENVEVIYDPLYLTPNKDLSEFSVEDQYLIEEFDLSRKFAQSYITPYEINDSV